MRLLVSLAFRNMARNPRRTVITLGGILVGVAAIVFIGGFAGGFVNLFTSFLAEGRLGAIQVHRTGFLQAEADPLKLDLPESGPLLDRIRAVSGVTAVAPRIPFEGMLANGIESTMVFAVAVDPERERRVCTRRWEAVPGVHDYRPADATDILVGRALLQGLGAEPGTELTLSATTRAGGTNALGVRVLASLGATDPQQSKRRVELTLRHAQALLGMEGRVTELALATAEGVPVEEVAARVKAALGGDYEVHTWRELASEFADLVRTIAVIMVIVVTMLILLVLSSITNTMLMAVHERTREIGTMLAMGMKRRRILLAVLVEAVALGIVGGVVGAVVGHALVELVHYTGFPVKPPESDVDNYLRPVPDVPFAVLAAVLCAVGAMLASVYPARRAAHLSPVEALRNE